MSVSLWQRLRIALGRLFPIRESTKFGTAKVYETIWHDGSPIRVLDVEGTLQSATYLDERWCETPFPYLGLFDKLFEQVPDAHNVLMLGGGGLAYPKHLVAHHPTARIDVVEVDPAIVRLAQRHFYLDRLEDTFHAQEKGRLAIVQQDAMDYLVDCGRKGVCYDAILDDCYAAGNFAQRLVSPEGVACVRACLAPDGAYLLNVVTALEGTQSASLHETVNVLGNAFAHVWAIPCSRYSPTEPDNVIIAASNQPPKPTDALRLFDAL